MAKLVYSFSIPCPPDVLSRALERAVERENEHSAGAHRVKLKWQVPGQQFDLRATFRARAGGRGARLRKGGVQAGTGIGLAVSASETFRVEIQPDGRGGSILRGRFRMLGPSTLFLAAFGGGCLLGWLLLRNGVYLLALLALLAAGFDVYRNSEKFPNSQWLLAFLEGALAELSAACEPARTEGADEESAPIV